MMPIRVVLADDHPLILDGMETLLRPEGGFEVCARCGDGAAALEAVRAYRPDVLVLDIRMPRMDGLEVLRRLRAEGADVRVVILTAAVDDDQVIEAVRLGVRGVVLKEEAPSALVRCLRTVHAGGRWIEQESLARAMDTLLRREAGSREAASRLTPREIEVVRMVARGLRNREIAEKHFVSEGTVKVHLHNIYEKLGVTSRLALGMYARERGLG
jgi:DNA-binding NarL/FixJ family response regulator